VRTAIEQVGDGTGEGGVHHGIDVGALVVPTFRETPNARSLARRESIGYGDFTRHASMVGEG
jgi:hypothetical protein